MSLTPEQRSTSARAAALTRWSRVKDRTAETRKAREAALARFADYPDPEGALRAHMTSIALKSSKARTVA